MSCAGVLVLRTECTTVYRGRAHICIPHSFNEMNSIDNSDSRIVYMLVFTGARVIHSSHLLE